MAAFFRLLARTTSLGKSREGLDPGAAHGEKLQDRGAWAGFIATALGVAGASFIPNGEVAPVARAVAAGVFFVLWGAAAWYVTALIRKFGKREVEPTGDALGTS